VDAATLVGLLAAIGIITGAIALGGGSGMFVDLPSLLIVLGGTVGAVLIKFTLGQFLGAFKVAMKAFLHRTDSPQAIIRETLELAAQARKGGLLALEGKEIRNAFLQRGVRLLVDGYEPEVVRQTLATEISATVERHELGQKIFKSIGDVSPAMGMIGTLIGLVKMLANMSDPSAIGPAMAVALLTTLYGALIANVFALPLADKLALRSDEERLVNSMILDAVVGIQQGRNPRVIEEVLKTYLPGSSRDTAAEPDPAAA